jgi:hypothetical protein
MRSAVVPIALEFLPVFVAYGTGPSRDDDAQATQRPHRLVAGERIMLRPAPRRGHPR